MQRRAVLLQATPELAAAFDQARGTGALYLSHMGLSRVPAQVFALTDLVRLDLGFNDLTELPPDIARLTNLEELWLNGACAVTSICWRCCDEGACAAWRGWTWSASPAVVAVAQTLLLSVTGIASLALEGSSKPVPPARSP